MNRRQMIMLAAMASSSAVGGASRRSHDSGALPLFDPMQFGAKGDGKALDSPAINAAIDACNQRRRRHGVFAPWRLSLRYRDFEKQRNFVC